MESSRQRADAVAGRQAPFASAREAGGGRGSLCGLDGRSRLPVRRKDDPGNAGADALSGLPRLPR